jgi:thiamine biosynthesis lipoprotein
VKGWAGERALDVLAAHGVVDAQVNAGGDVAATGRRADGRPWRIGIAHPIRRDGLVAVLEGTDLRVATSGTTERAGHLRRGGRPVDDVLSVSVAGDDLGRADALSTALAAVGPHRTTLAHELDAAGWPSLTVSPDGSVATTPGWSCSPRWVAS